MIGTSPEFTARGAGAVRFRPAADRAGATEFTFVASDGLWRNGAPVPLPPRALGVLAALLSTPGSVVSKQELMDAVWPGTFVTESSLLEAVGRVRDALGDDRRNPGFIQTVHRRGYRFIAVVERAAPEPRLQPLEPSPPLEPLELESSEPSQFFAGPQWRPIVMACATYALTTVCVAMVFAIFGQRPIERRAVVVSAPFMAPRAAVSGAWPSWTPEGIEIAFAFSKAGPFSAAATWDRLPTSVSPDGHLLVFAEPHPMSGTDLWLFDVRTQARRPLVRTWSDETFARFSPDGNSVAYMSNLSGRWEVYVQSLAETTPLRVSTGGGAWPSWSTDGATLYFTTDAATMAAAIATTPSLTAAAPLIAQHHGARASRAELRIVLDWFSELARVRPS